MGFQDLTPQLRTRLSRVERTVGLFVLLATLLLLTGFGYYIYHTAEQRGWFVRKVPYHIYLHSAMGLKVGDKVKLNGFEVGEITQVDPTPIADWFDKNSYNVFVSFWIKAPNYGYILRDSEAKVNVKDLLGNRFIEVTRGKTGEPTFKDKGADVIEMLSRKEPGVYITLTNGSKGYWLQVDETPAVTEKLDELVKFAQSALPGILDLTNKISQTLTNTTITVSNANALLSSFKPVATNLSAITASLRNPTGSLGEWLFPTNINRQLEGTLVGAQATFTNVNKTLTNVDLTLTSTRSAVTNVDANLAEVLMNLNRSLDSLAGITSNLNVQVQSNTNMLTEISTTIVHADDMIQGLKRHWLLRSAFRTKSTNAPPPQPVPVKPFRGQP